MKQSLDSVFYSIIEDLVGDATKNAAKSAENILAVTSKYLSIESYSTLKEFCNLYLAASRQIDDAKDSINKQVDDLFEQAQGVLASGETLTGDSLKEADGQEVERLGLSGLQKKLESIVNLEEGLKEKLFPILSSMQFEDFTRHRLTHILFGYNRIINWVQNPETTSLSHISQEIATELSSVSETEIYYNLVMKAPPPGGLKEKSILLEF